ncbi:MAG: hypothetical protein BKP49_00740 [Treponema sp. CETP13]|nr:MAG: hypothetical protein BKP49_00740 [Treponema sp. CETP13]
MKSTNIQKNLFTSLFTTIVFALCVVNLFISCASSKEIVEDKQAKGTLTIDDDSDNSLDFQNNESTLKGINHASSRADSFFYFSDNQIMENAVIGTPEHLKKTISLLYKSDQNYSEQEKVLISICIKIMQEVWPESQISWKIPDELPENLYLDTLNSSFSGIYEPVKTTEDFFSLLLPSLTLFTLTPVDQYAENSEAALKEALRLQPDSILATYMLGILYLKTDRSDKAIPLLQKAASAVPSSDNISKALITAFGKNIKSTTSYDEAKAILATNPENKEYLILLAQIAYDLEDYQNAEVYIAKVLQQEPSNKEYLMLRAKILFKEEKYLQVSTILDVFSRSNYITRDYLLLRAQLQIEWNKNSTAAIATLEKALEQYKNDIEVLTLAAKLASTTSQKINGQTAMEIAQNLLKDDSSNINALVVIVDENIKNKDWQSAYLNSNKTLKLSPSDVNVYLNHVEICIELNKISEARDIIDMVNEKYFSNNNNTVSKKNLESFQKWNLRVLRAESKNSQVQKLIDIYMKDASSDLKSILYYEKSFIENSAAMQLSDLRLSLTSNPRNTDSLYALYEYYFEKSDYQKARYYLRQVIALKPSDLDLLDKNTQLDTLLSQ